MSNAMPTRILREGILTSPRVNKLSAHAELFYRRLMSVVDDYGRYYAHETLLRAACYPFQLDRVKEDYISKHLAECVGVRLIFPYTANGAAYLQLIDFRQQTRAKSKFPAPPEHLISKCETDAKQMESGCESNAPEVEVEVEVEVGVVVNPSLSESSIPPCPHDDLRALFAKHLPMLTQPRVWDGARASAMRARWQQCGKVNGFSPGYTTKQEGLEFWEKFFAGVAATKTLTDGIPRQDGSSWKPDLPWLLKAENFAKVIEGKYS